MHVEAVVDDRGAVELDLDVGARAVISMSFHCPVGLRSRLGRVVDGPVVARLGGGHVVDGPGPCQGWMSL